MSGMFQSNIRAALRELTGAGMVGIDPSTYYPPDTVGGALSGSINVLDYLTAAQIMNAHLRLGTLDCGPGLQAAINAADRKNLIWPAGYIFGCGQELIVRTIQKWKGGGKGQMLAPFDPNNHAVTELKTVGSGAAYKTVKTRVKYRASAADPQDDPISALVNIQHQGFSLEGIVIRCSYDEPTMLATPNYFGDDWDVGVFIGCRLHCKISDNAVIGCWRKAAILCDVTRGPGLPELYGWDGIQHPADGTQYGGDGCSMSELITWGGKWGVLVKGADPKPGLVSYGIDYTVSLAATLAALPLEGDTLTVGELTFTFRADASGAQDVSIGLTADETASNFVDACVDIIESTEDYPIFRSAIYINDGNVVRTFRRDSNSTYYQLNFTASTVSGGRITLSSAAPAVIADPAPYYDQQLGAAVTDQRGNFGFSDFSMRDSQIFGSNSPTRYARQAIRADKNWLLDTAGGAFYIDGLAGNSSRMLHGHRYNNVRFDGRYDPFIVRLGRTQRDEFFACHWDGLGSNQYFTPEGVNVGIGPKNFKYGSVTKEPWTRRTRFYSRDTAPWVEYCSMDDVGSANVADGSGRTEFSGNFTVRKGRLIVDRSAKSNGTAQVQINGGTAGSSRVEFRTPNGINGAIRYYHATGTMRLACGGNYNNVLWTHDPVAKTASQTMTPIDSTGTGIYSSTGSVQLSADNGEADIRCGAGSSIRWRAGVSTIGLLSANSAIFTISSFLRATTDNGPTLGIPSVRWSNTYTTILTLGAGVTHTASAGTPEGAVTAAVGSAHWDTTNGVQYNKKTGTGNTGWKLVTQAA